MMKSRKSTRTQNRIVLAVDPGFHRLGIAVVTASPRDKRVLFSECFDTKPKESREERLLALGTHIKTIINEWRPNDLSVEKLFFNKNTTSAIGVAEARGVVIYEARKAGLEIFEYGPQTVKLAVTGYGKADKKQVEVMVRRMVKIPGVKKLDDEIDAIALCITHIATVSGI